MRTREPGEKLPNGAVVALHHVIEANLSFVLAYNDGSATPWVTWRMNDNGSTFWGNYHRELPDAIIDFITRADILTRELALALSRGVKPAEHAQMLYALWHDDVHGYHKYVMGIRHQVKYSASEEQWHARVGDDDLSEQYRLPSMAAQACEDWVRASVIQPLLPTA